MKVKFQGHDLDLPFLTIEDCGDLLPQVLEVLQGLDPLACSIDGICSVVQEFRELSTEACTLILGNFSSLMFAYLDYEVSLQIHGNHLNHATYSYSIRKYWIETQIKFLKHPVTNFAT